MKITNKQTISTGRDVLDAAISPDGKLLATAGEKPGLKLYDLVTGNLLKEEKAAYSRLAFSPDGQYLALGGRNIKVIDCQKFKKVATLQTKTSRGFHVLQMNFLPDSQQLLSCAEQTAQSSAVVLWDLPTGNEAQRYDFPYSNMDSIDLSTCGRYFVANDISMFRLYNLETEQRINTQQSQHRAWTVKFTPKTTHLVHEAVPLQGSTKKALRFWDINQWKEDFELVHKQGSILDFSFSPNGQNVATLTAPGNARRVWLWDLTDREKEPVALTKTLKFDGHNEKNCPRKIAFWGDTKLLATKFNGEIEIWDLEK